MENPIEAIGNFVFLEDTYKSADFIIVTGDYDESLAIGAVKLFVCGYGNKIILSGGHTDRFKYDISEAEFLCNLITQYGVNKEHMILETSAKNTFENAIFSEKIIKEIRQKAVSVIIVCKAYHSRRVLLTFERIFSGDTKIFIKTVIDRNNTTKDNWYLEEFKFFTVMDEVKKIGEYFRNEIPFFVEKYKT